MTMDAQAVFDRPSSPRRYRFDELGTLYEELGAIPAVRHKESQELQGDKQSHG